MTGAELAADLVGRGLHAGELAAKRDLFGLVLARYRALPAVSDAPRPADGCHAWWVPGRLEVFGTHTDYAGGRALVCAVPRGFAVVAHGRPDGVLRVIDAKREQDITLLPAAADGPAAPTAYTGWRHYVDVVARRLARNFPGAALGADIVIASDLPRASGMSSSSALVVAVAAALVRVARLTERAEWARDIATPLDAAGYYACLENGLSFGSLLGDAGVGTHGGSEDHAAIVAGVPGRLRAFAFVPMRAIDEVALPGGWRFVLAPCGVTAQKTGAARDAYNHLALGTGTLLEIWNASSAEAAPSLAAALLSGGARVEEGAARLRRLVGGTDVGGWPRPALVRRLDHFVREDARVPEAVAAFRGADRPRLGQLADDSQADAESLLGNQIPETIALSRRARELGAFAARSFGAGFGGSVWALVERDQAGAFARRWHPEAFVAAPGPAVIEL